MASSGLFDVCVMSYVVGASNSWWIVFLLPLLTQDRGSVASQATSLELHLFTDGPDHELNTMSEARPIALA